jgi:hypothetical protein
LHAFTAMILTIVAAAAGDFEKGPVVLGSSFSRPVFAVAVAMLASNMVKRPELGLRIVALCPRRHTNA